MAQGQMAAALTADEVSLLKAHVRELLQSAQFRNSKRYPRFLQKVVNCTISGTFEELKERTLGHSVFDRAADYDTSADPIVRITAGEIRKRLAQYYQENDSLTPVRISLPVGGYIPEFHFGPARDETTAEDLSPRALATEAQDSEAEVLAPTGMEQPLHAQEGGSAVHWRLVCRVALASSCVTLILVVLAYLAERGLREARIRSLSHFWAPMMVESNPAPFIIGRTTLVLPLDSDPSLEASLLGIRSKIALSDALAFSRVCSLVRTETRNCTLQLSNQATISDLRRGPVVVVGLFNNEWSSRLLAPLRFRIKHNVDVHGITHEAWITDAKDPKARWGLDFGERMDLVQKDYGVLARFDSAITGRPVFIVGGLSSLGTEGIGELATDPKAMEKLEATIPKNRSFQNFEAVIETEVINGKPGQSRIVAEDFW